MPAPDSGGSRFHHRGWSTNFEFCPVHDRSVHRSPIVALRAKRQRQYAWDPIILGFEVTGNADDDPRLGDVQAQRAMESVPPGEDHREVAVVFSANMGMMDAVHARRDEDLVEQALHHEWQANVAVMKQGPCFEGELIYREGQWRDTEQYNLNDSKTGRQRDFAEVKAECSGNVEVRVDVVDVMKAPKNGDLVIGLVPIIKRQVQEYEADDERHRFREL